MINFDYLNKIFSFDIFKIIQINKNYYLWYSSSAESQIISTLLFWFMLLYLYLIGTTIQQTRFNLKIIYIVNDNKIWNTALSASSIWSSSLTTLLCKSNFNTLNLCGKEYLGRIQRWFQRNSHRWILPRYSLPHKFKVLKFDLQRSVVKLEDQIDDADKAVFHILLSLTIYIIFKLNLVCCIDF